MLAVHRDPVDEVGEHPAGSPGDLQGPFDLELDRLGVERGSVVIPNALAQLESERSAAVANLP
jgi:hypothetical protein